MVKFFLHYLFSAFSFIKSGLQKAVFLRLFIDIKLIYFVTNTGWGYFLYICALSVIFGTKTHQGGLFFLLCLVFSCYVISTALFLFVLVKTPLTRKYLRNLFGEDFLVKHLGPR